MDQTIEPALDQAGQLPKQRKSKKGKGKSIYSKTELMIRKAVNQAKHDGTYEIPTLKKPRLKSKSPQRGHMKDLAHSRSPNPGRDSIPKPRGKNKESMMSMVNPPTTKMMKPQMTEGDLRVSKDQDMLNPKKLSKKATMQVNQSTLAITSQNIFGGAAKMPVDPIALGYNNRYKRGNKKRNLKLNYKGGVGHQIAATTNQTPTNMKQNINFNRTLEPKRQSQARGSSVNAQIQLPNIKLGTKSKGKSRITSPIDTSPLVNGLPLTHNGVSPGIKKNVPFGSFAARGFESPILEHAPADDMASQRSEAKPMSIWDKIQLHDTHKYQKELLQSKIKQSQEKQDLKKYYDLQVNEKMQKSNIERQRRAQDHEQVLQRINQYDQESIVKNTKAREMNLNQNQVNDIQINQKQYLKQQMKADEIKLDKKHVKAKQHEINYQLLKEHEQKRKVQQETQNQLKTHIEQQRNLQHQTISQDLNDQRHQMNHELDYLDKEQQRHKNKINELIGKNDRVYSQYTSDAPTSKNTYAQSTLLKQKQLDQLVDSNMVKEQKRKAKEARRRQEQRMKDERQLQQVQMEQMKSKAQEMKLKQMRQIKMERDLIEQDRIKAAESTLGQQYLKQKKQQETKDYLESTSNPGGSNASPVRQGDAYFNMDQREMQLNKQLISELN